MDNKGNQSTFLDNDKPSFGVKSILKYKEFGNILDLGCGNCRNSAYLVKNARFNYVYGIDLDEDALISSNKILSSVGVKFDLEKTDLTKFNLPDRYDVILNSFTIPYLDRDGLVNLILKNQQLTNSNGLNFYAYYTDKSMYEYSDKIKNVIDSRNFMQFYSNGWELLETKKFKVESVINRGTFFDCEYVIFQKK